MQKIIFLLIVIALISGCVEIPDPNIASVPGKTEKTTEDILVRAEVAQPILKAGRPTNIRFTVENKQPFVLKNFQLSAYDLCDFSCEPSPVVWSEQEIRTNISKTKTFQCRAPQTEFERSCALQFKASYEAELFQTHGVVVLSESEFATGRKHSAQLSETTESPLKISAKWSEEKPFVENDNVSLTLEYSYTGDGIINILEGSLEPNKKLGAVKITLPSNLEAMLPLETTCADFSGITIEKPPKTLQLKRNLTFIDKSAKPSTCLFKTKASQPIDSGSLRIDAHFTYQMDGSVPIKVRPK